MLPDRVSNPGPLTYESGALPIALRGPALEEHNGKVSIGGRNITNLRFADDIGALAEEEQELEALVESLDKTCT